MSTQGKFYGHATALVRHTMLQEVGRLKSLLGTDNAVTLKNIARIEGVAGAEAMKDEQLTTYIDLLHRSLPVHLQGIPASESIPAPSDATLTAQSEGGLREALAEALEAFWSPAIGAIRAASHHGPASGSDVIEAIAQGFAAMASSLRESQASTPATETPTPDAVGREGSDRSDALIDSAYLAGAKAGWNLGVSEDNEGFARLQQSRAGYLAVLKATPPPAAPEQADSASFSAAKQQQNTDSSPATRTNEGSTTAAPEQDSTKAHAREESAHLRTIGQRDHAEEIIDRLCNAVLGVDRNEWSSAYGFDDAVSEVENRMAELAKAPAPSAQPWAPVTDVEWAVLDDGQSIDFADCSDNQLSIVLGRNGIAYFAGYTPEVRTHGRVYVDERVNPVFVQAMQTYALRSQGGVAQGAVVDEAAKGRNPFLQTVLDNLAEALDEHEDCWSGYANEVNDYLGLPHDASPWPTLEQWRREREALAPQQTEGGR